MRAVLLFFTVPQPALYVPPGENPSKGTVVNTYVCVSYCIVLTRCPRLSLSLPAAERVDRVLAGGDRDRGGGDPGVDDGATEDPGGCLLGAERGLAGDPARLLLPAVHHAGHLSRRQGVCVCVCVCVYVRACMCLLVF